jgi:GAF domain-containing protein
LNPQGTPELASQELLVGEESAFQRSLGALSQFFVGDRTMLETLDRVAEITVEAIIAAEFVGVTMMADGKPQTSAFSDHEAPEIDEAQYQTGDGPCLESFRTGEARRIDSTRDETRWPAFCATCLDHDILSTLSLPMTVEDETYGALNLYSRKEYGFGPNELKTGSLFAAQAAIVLANARSYWDARSRAEQLEVALSSRAEIEQAKGIIMSTMRCTADDAFDILVKQSQRENRKLREVAREIAARTSHRP